MPPKRKAEVLHEDSNAQATGTRRTRSGGSAAPVETTGTTSRGSNARSTGPAVAPIRRARTYGGRRITKVVTVTDSEEDSEEEDKANTKIVAAAKPKSAGRTTRGRGRATVEPDAASTSSKENKVKPPNVTRGRTKTKVEEPEETVPDSEEEIVEEPVKRRRTAPPIQEVTDTKEIPSVPSKRSTRATTAHPASTTIAEKGKPPIPPKRASRSRVDQPAQVTDIVPPKRKPGRPPGIRAAPPVALKAALTRDAGSPEPVPPKTRRNLRGAGSSKRPRSVSPSPVVKKPSARGMAVAASEDSDGDNDSSQDSHAPQTPSKKSAKRQTAGKRTTERSNVVAKQETEVQLCPPEARISPCPSAKAASPLFSEPEDESDEELPIPPKAPVPRSPIKKRVVVVELPATPRGKRGVAQQAVPGPSSHDDDSDEAEGPLPSSQSRQVPTTPSRRQRVGFQSVPASPTKPSGGVSALPPHLVPCLNAQKRAVLRALSNPPTAISATSILPLATGKGKGKAKVVESEAEEAYDNMETFEQLKNLLEGTVSRNEGNSCLLIGPKGSGKTRVFERCISEFSRKDSKIKPIVIRLSGWVQSNDRLALRQIAIQLAEQTGNNQLLQLSEGGQSAADEDDNPFVDNPVPAPTEADPDADTFLPPPSQISECIKRLLTLSRPTIVLVDAFDLFALHARQALLYCLLDTAQACQSSQGDKGLAIVGLTSRVDVVNLFEKRVKSRFSGRLLRVGPVPREQDWMAIVRGCLTTPAELPLSHVDDDNDATDSDLSEWTTLWNSGIQKFLEDSVMLQVVRDTYSVVRDVRTLVRLLVPTICRLSPNQPFPTSAMLSVAAETQRTRTPFPSLHTLPYPALCLVIASYHSHLKGHSIFNFEMLFEGFQVQVRASAAAPIQLNGTSIGMPKCSRSVMLCAFESLVATRVFVATAAHSVTTPKEFVKYRSLVEREDLKKAVEKAGQVALKKWWSKA